MNKARVIITEKCDKKCKYCCNKQENIKSVMQPISYIEDVLKFQPNCKEVMITGGEPMLRPHLVKQIVFSMKKWNSRWRKDIKVYLYSAMYTHHLGEVMPFIDGLQYTLHTSTDMDMYRFYELQRELSRYKYSVRSFRLYIRQNITDMINIRPSLWNRVEVKPWIVDCPLPSDEELFVLR